MALILSKAGVRALKDPAIKGRWFTYVPDVLDQTEVLVEQISVPFLKTQPAGRFTAGAPRYYPTMWDVDGLQCVFYETHDFKVTTWLEAWRNKVYDPETGIFGSPKDYRREFVIDFFPIQSEKAVMRRSYMGCCPIEQQSFELTYSEIDGRITVSAQFFVNRILTDFFPENAVTPAASATGS